MGDRASRRVDAIDFSAGSLKSLRTYTTERNLFVEYITKGVKKLDKADRPPQVGLSTTIMGHTHCYLQVQRNGIPYSWRISKTIAAELIAAGFAHGN